MINIRIYDKDSKHIFSIVWNAFSIRRKFDNIVALDKAFTFANSRFGINRYYFSILDYCDNLDYRFIGM